MLASLSWLNDTAIVCVRWHLDKWGWSVFLTPVFPQAHCSRKTWRLFAAGRRRSILKCATYCASLLQYIYTKISFWNVTECFSFGFVFFIPNLKVPYDPHGQIFIFFLFWIPLRELHIVYPKKRKQKKKTWKSLVSCADGGSVNIWCSVRP